MRLGFRRKGASIGIVIITGSCCIPGMAPLEEQARRIVDQAVSETGVTAEVKMIAAATAYFGGIPKEVMAQIMAAFNQTGQMPLPAILIDGNPVSYGVPKIEDIKSVLLQSARTIKEEGANE
jgi:hypothetical protein